MNDAVEREDDSGALMCIRSRYYPFVGGAVALAGGASAVVQCVNDPELGTGFAIGFAGVAGLLLYRLTRVALIEKDGHLVVRNVSWTRRIAWSDVEEITVGWIPGNGRSAAIAFALKGHRIRRTASATTCYSRSRARYICSTVASRALANGVPCTLDPDELRSGV